MTRGNILVCDCDGSKKIVLVNIYSQSDSYPEGLGAQIAEFLKNRVVGNSLGANMPAKYSNTIEELAAQLVYQLKGACKVGGIYLQIPKMVTGENDYTCVIYPVYKKAVGVFQQVDHVQVEVFSYKKKVFNGTPQEFLRWCSLYNTK
jgi:hypothetical protein